SEASLLNLVLMRVRSGTALNAGLPELWMADPHKLKLVQLMTLLSKSGLPGRTGKGKPVVRRASKAFTNCSSLSTGTRARIRLYSVTCAGERQLRRYGQ